MRVRLINHTPNAEKMVAIAARMCYSPLSASEMIEGLDQETIQKMVAMAAENHHDSLMEHITFTFIVEGVSRVLSHQLVRHRIATYHQRSQRYVKENLLENVVIPPSVLVNKDALKLYESAILYASDAYNKLIDMGVNKEDARYLLPNATETQLIVTMNARELIHFFGLRLCNRAQREIRFMAMLMLKECRKVCPLLFDSVGPNCIIQGKCPEGKMSCGRSVEVKSSFEPTRLPTTIANNKSQWQKK